MLKRLTFFYLACLGLVTAMHSAWAAADPPARVGRISAIAGEVSFYTGTEWQRASLNFPVTSSHAISTAKDSRAEIRIGSLAIRIGADTELNLTTIDDQTVQLGLPKGELSINLQGIRSGESYEVVTADTTVALMRPGRVRIDADPNDETTRLTVFHGLATATRDGATTTVRADESVVLGNDEPEYGKAAIDDFDRWVLAREQEYEESKSAHVSPETTGYEELDRYGDWDSHETYGSLWYPRDVPAGWAPYRYGYWSWVNPWGWSWIDHSPWGFAPFHYGRWVYHHNRWGWWPGHYAHYPVYAPALVAYVGQPHSSVSIAFGSYPLIGWFPLAPFEPFYPGYGYSSIYLSHINRGYVRHPVVPREPNQPRVDFANRKFHQAMTVVPQRAFVNERPVAPSTIPVVASPPPSLITGTSAPLAPRVVHGGAIGGAALGPQGRPGTGAGSVGSIGQLIQNRTIAPNTATAPASQPAVGRVAPGVVAAPQQRSQVPAAGLARSVPPAPTAASPNTIAPRLSSPTTGLSGSPRSSTRPPIYPGTAGVRTIAPPSVRAPQVVAPAPNRYVPPAAQPALRSYAPPAAQAGSGLRSYAPASPPVARSAPAPSNGRAQAPAASSPGHSGGGFARGAPSGGNGGMRGFGIR